MNEEDINAYKKAAEKVKGDGVSEKQK